MAEKVVKTIIQLRRGTEEQWAENGGTFVPKAGEPCLTLDGENAGRVKYGDGTSTWAKLPYSGGTDVVEVDSSIVKFDDDFTFTYAFGKYSPDSSGQVNVPATGKTLDQLLLDAFAEEKEPQITQPSVSVSSGEMKAYEAGTNVTPKYNASLNKGSYQYGPDTGITATSWSVQFDSQTLTEASGTFTQIQVTDSTNLKITATAQYGDGAIPVTNLGTPKEELKIVAGSKSGSTGSITGYRQIFYGVRTEATEITSSVIRSLTPTNKAAAGMTINSLKAGEGAKQFVIAVPQSSGLRVTAANITSSLNADVTSSYVKQGPVEVEGANGYQTVPYDVFVYQPASIDPTEDHKIVIGK